MRIEINQNFNLK